MSPILAIIKKDFRALFGSPVFYLLAGLCCILWSLYFSFSLYTYVGQSFQLSSQSMDTGLNIHQQIISGYIVVVHYLLIFVIAALNMKFFAEEKKDENILSFVDQSCVILATGIG